MKTISKGSLIKTILTVAIIVIFILGVFVFTNILSDSKNIIENNLFSDDYIKAGVNGKFGLINKLGHAVMPFKYDNVVYDSKSETAAVMLEGKWGFADKNGNIKVKPEYDKVGMFGKNNLAPVLKGDKWGYIDKNGKVVIECKYISAMNFSENGLAAVTGEGRPYYINEKGEKALDIEYDMLGDFNENGYAVVCIKEKFGVINSKGVEIIKPEYDREFSVDKKGFAVVSNGEKYGAINIKGENILPFEYDFIIPTVAMYNSADVKSGFSKAYFIIFINQLLESYDLFDNNDIAIAVKDGKAGLVNSKGKVILEPKFEQLQVYHESNVVLVSDGEKYMYYDVNGKQLVAGEKFDKTNGFNNGLGVVIEDSKWGYVNKNGNYIIEPQFESALGFSKNNLAAVRQNEKWGYINKNGEFAIEPSYKYASTFVENIAKVYDGKVWKLVKGDGKVVLDNIASEPGLYSDGYAVVEMSDGYFALYDLDGVLIAKTKCNMLGNNHKSLKLCQFNDCYNDAVEGTAYCTEHGVQ